MKDYNSIRKSVQESITLFNKLKNDLKPAVAPNVPVSNTHTDVNAIMRRSQQLCTFFGGCSM